MKGNILLIGSCIVLFFLYAFKLNNRLNFPSGTAIEKRNIISCGPEKNRYRNKYLDEEISINDNRKSAGVLKNGVLYLKLETRKGNWFPETHDGESLPVYAFAEVGKPMQLPGPVIRVTEGVVINAEIHNTIPGSPLVLHGLYSRPGNVKDSISIPYGKTYKIQFKAGKAGTYFYWATDGTYKYTDAFGGLPYSTDSQLYGAFIIDPPRVKADPEERIFMIGIWNDSLGEELVMNGLTWPYTERLSYQKNVPVHWRLINASNQEHPMHLHGFFYTVNSRGNADTDNVYHEKERYLSVTELLLPHQTMSITWTPEREGNWLFHCHTLVHIMAGSFLRKEPEMTEEHMNDISTHARDGMGGLLMGITVLPSKNGDQKAPDKKIPERELTLIVQEKKNYYDTLMGFGFVLREGNVSTDASGSIPGPPIILERGKPVAIKIINHLHEATTLHWHGLEIESYFDGVAGWGNRGKELAPLLMPGDSFIVHMTPPRAGTFMYHTHMHNMELMEGMYGPMIVTEPGEKFNNTTNKILLISQGGVAVYPRLLFLNGKVNPDTMMLQPGVNYRLRIINITALGPDLTVSLLLNGVPVSWRALAKDGADLPIGLQKIKPARDQIVSIGQTVDFAFKPGKAGNYLFAVKDYQDSTVLSRVLKVQ
ncbi:MAG: multicopper oxidase domain-containing protein [Chitinophagales bacterium]